MKKALSLMLCVTLLLGIIGCADRSEEGKLYDELTAKNSTASSEVASSAPESRKVEESEVSQAESEEEVPEDPDRYVQKLEWNQLFDIEPNTELSGTLTIGVDSSKTLEPWVETFQAVYPNVEIKTKLYSGDLEEIVVDLNSGAAGDILYIGGLSLFKFGESGLLMDLYPFIDADPELQREDFYPNILKAMETREGKLCTITPEISIDTVYFNTLVTDQLDIDFLKEYADGMDYKDIVGLYKRCIEEGLLEEGTPLSAMGSKDYLGSVELMAYLDEASRECDFTNPGFIEFLDTMNSIPAGVDLYWDSFSSDYPFEDRSEFMVRGIDRVYQLDCYRKPNQEFQNTPWMPVKTTDGKKPFSPVLPLGITSACQNTELAWEFVRFMLSEKPFPEKPDEGYNDMGYCNLYRVCVPFNRKNFGNLFKAYFDDDELFEYVDNLYSQRDTVVFRDGMLETVWSDIKQEFYENGLISAEECAKQMQERTWIYMNE